MINNLKLCNRILRIWITVIMTASLVMSAFPVWAVEPEPSAQAAPAASDEYAAADDQDDEEITEDNEDIIEEETGAEPAISDDVIDSDTDDTDTDAEVVIEDISEDDSEVVDTDADEEAAVDTDADDDIAVDYDEDEPAEEPEALADDADIKEEPAPKASARKAMLRASSRAADPTKSTITVTKTWEGDDDSVRPDNLTIYLKRKRSDAKTGQTINDDMAALAGALTNIQAVRWASESEYNAAVSAGRTIRNEAVFGSSPLYMWYDSGTIKFYSESDNVYLNADSRNMFKLMTNLTDISAVAMFNTTYVEDMAGMFTDCTKLVDLSPLSGWDTGNVTSMRLMLGSNVTTDYDSLHMHYTSIEALSNWNTQKVQDMGMMFKGAKYITSVEPISGWNVSNLLNMNQMFFRTNSLESATALEDWDVVRVGRTYTNTLTGAVAPGSFASTLGRSGALGLTTVPYFTNRPGTWEVLFTSGTFTPLTPTASGEAPTTTKVKDSDEYDSTDTVCTVTKNANVWTYEFTVSNDGTNWFVWEDTNDGTHVYDKAGNQDGYSESSGGTDGLGGSESNAIKGLKPGDSASITNTWNYKYVKAEKTWDDDGDAYGLRPADLELSVAAGSQTYTADDAYEIDKTSVPNKWSYTWVVPKNAAVSVSEVVPAGYEQTQAPTLNPNTGVYELTNSLKTIDLDITKKVTGNQADKTKVFDFTIKVYKGSDAIDLSGIAGMTSQGGGVYSFSLKDTESIEITDIPYGFSYEVSETDYTADGYTTSVEISGDEYTAEDSGAASAIPEGSGIRNVSDSYLVEDTTVSFTNDKSGALPTGVFSDSESLLIMLFASLFGLLIILLFIIRQRKTSDDRDILYL